jgi:hypothetical protein
MRETPDELDPARRPQDRYGAISSAGVPPLGSAARHAYDPNQPRVPAGHHEGGQWTATPGSGTPSQRREAILDRSGKESWGSYVNTYRSDGTLAEQRVFNRDGSRIVSEFGDGAGRWDERHTVVTADRRKFVFENRGGVQTVYDEDGRPISVSAWTENGPEALTERAVRFRSGDSSGSRGNRGVLGDACRPSRGAGGDRGGGAAVCVVLAPEQPRRHHCPVVSRLRLRSPQSQECRRRQGRSCTYQRRESDRGRTQGGKKYQAVQDFTNQAAKEATGMRSDWTAQRFGTEVHKRVACDVNGRDKKTGECKSAGKADNPNFIAEASLRKTLEADPNAKIPADPAESFAPYGERGTIRMDVFEKPEDHNAVCIFDIKTGEKVLSITRIRELMGIVHQHWKNVDQIFVVEVRPPAGVSP